jgi:TPR repeat protein
MENNNQKQQQQPENSEVNKKESTNSDGNDDTPPTSSSKPKDILHDDVCSICMDDVSIMDINAYFLCTQCGKVMHLKCAIQLHGTVFKGNCPMCRAPFVADGSKEEFERLQKWVRLRKPWAEYILGTKYAKGNGVPLDAKRACVFFKSAADQGHHVAQFTLGIMYSQGQGVIQSDQLSLKYHKQSADQGFAKAQYNVAVAYASGTGVERADTEAIKYYTLAADKGHHNAQNNLGVMYQEGRGVIQSDTNALELFKLSAEGGVVDAQYNAGSYYYNGTGVEQSNKNARKWWTKAAKQGQQDAIHNLKVLDQQEGIKTTSSSSNFTDNSIVLCSKCNKPAQTNRTLRDCKCKGAQYCNNTCYHAHWKEHKPEHNRLVKLLNAPSTGETKEEPTENKMKTTDENKSKTKKQKPNDRCACGSKKKYKKCCGSKKR